MELVGVYDIAGREVGAVDRAMMRAQNLHHGATAVVVVNERDEVYVHRRTDSKDIYPGRCDFAAGGVMAYQEAPLVAAQRELAEELGISGVELYPIWERNYTDEHTSFRAFCYWTRWSGDIVWQPEEVAWGDWLPIPEVLDRVQREPAAWMPDTVAVLGPWLRERRPPFRVE